tara:strand:+ start:253 stop:549 length:297 start_codon:yes stop_codon:yes gene_type:complete
MAKTNTKGPEYYKRGSIETWDFIRSTDLNFHLGNAIKYIVRAGHKDSKTEDLKKAIHYLENELQNTYDSGPSEGIQISLSGWKDEYTFGSGTTKESYS